MPAPNPACSAAMAEEPVPEAAAAAAPAPAQLETFAQTQWEVQVSVRNLELATLWSSVFNDSLPCAASFFTLSHVRPDHHVPMHTSEGTVPSHGVLVCLERDAAAALTLLKAFMKASRQHQADPSDNTTCCAGAAAVPGGRGAAAATAADRACGP